MSEEARAEAERLYANNPNFWQEKHGFIAGAEWQASRKPDAAPSETVSTGEHKRVLHQGTYVCDTCVNSLGLNVRWDRIHLVDGHPNPEAAPAMPVSDTDLREAMEAALKRVSFRGNGEEIGTEEVAVMVNDAIDALLPLFSQPVQAEVTTEMVERAAEAIWDRWGHPGMFKHAPVHRQNSFRADARAALESLSRVSQPVQVEVTDEMVARAEREYQWSGNIRKVLTAALGGGE